MSKPEYQVIRQEAGKPDQVVYSHPQESIAAWYQRKCQQAMGCRTIRFVVVAPSAQAVER